MSVVEIKGLTKQFGRGGTTALQGIDLAIVIVEKLVVRRAPENFV